MHITRGSRILDRNCTTTKCFKPWTILFQALMRQKRSEMIDRSITGSDRPNGPNSSIFGSTSQFGNSEMGGPNFDDEEMVRDRPSTVPRNVLSENIGHQMGHYFPFEASF